MLQFVMILIQYVVFAVGGWKEAFLLRPPFLNSSLFTEWELFTTNSTVKK